MYWQLFWAFFRVGGLTFGGGLAQLPMLKYEIVQKYHWLEEEEMIDIYAIGQCTPGIIAINTATYVGYKKKGILGGIVSTLGMVTPSLVIITLAALCLQAIIDNVWVQHAIMGVRAVVCALMLNTAYTLSKKTIKDKFSIFIAVLAFLAAFFSGLPTVVIVICAAVIGIFVNVKLAEAKAVKKDKGSVSETNEGGERK
ncbi:MAG: chromate transporter [Eubacteriales bacterium]|nr:chromate transporter [Eubacteriales bacterium]